MEIDLSAGLMKAKPAKTALPGGDMPVDDSPNAAQMGALDFSALLPASTDIQSTGPAMETALVLAPVPPANLTKPEMKPDQPIETTTEIPSLAGAAAPQLPAATPVADAAEPAIVATAPPAQTTPPLTTTKVSVQVDGVQVTKTSPAATTLGAAPATPEPDKKTANDAPAIKTLDPAAKPAAADQPAPQAPLGRAVEPVTAPTAAPTATAGPNVSAPAQPAPPKSIPGVSELALSTDIAESDIAVAIKIDRQTADIQQIAQQPQRAATAVATQISTQIQAQISQGSKQVIELRLDPTELGRVTIQLSPQDQSITAQITAERPETLDLMRRHSEVLLATLEKAGFAQTNLSFQQGTPQQGGRDAQRFQSLGFVADPTAPTLSAPLLPAADGRLDIRL